MRAGLAPSSGTTRVRPVQQNPHPGTTGSMRCAAGYMRKGVCARLHDAGRPKTQQRPLRQARSAAPVDTLKGISSHPWRADPSSRPPKRAAHLIRALSAAIDTNLAGPSTEPARDRSARMTRGAHRSAQNQHRHHLRAPLGRTRKALTCTFAKINTLVISGASKICAAIS